MAISNAARVALIEQKLQAALDPIQLNIIDDSHLHAGHAGAKESGGGHFSIQVISPIFQAKSLVERHRMVYVALGDTMGNEIHALSIKAQTPEEATQQLMQ